ncbi:MAG: NADH-quinone oxidoreductase subunit M [Candidatus Bathyarchaeota archaeon]|nr:NADH-quinone oxidoreductase subunit M [Candidatus Bathyarchaeota archaeon]MCX8177705.1 NADH-quinone oxidoreductase subunit M [Candidatus Bathyarchaeota archaeon]MDW8193965.1 NADH-quinone oxidoreductase subunit M [Nitrososphaerota archaeon]
MPNTLLSTLLLPALTIPLVYILGKKSPKAAAALIAMMCICDAALLSTTVPVIINGKGHIYVESYQWVPALRSSFTLFIDGISFLMAIVTLILMLAAAIFSIDYMHEKKGLAEYYALLTLLSIGLVGVFLTSNLLLFYFCWELMLLPAYFIIGGWGYREPYRAAFKFFIFTHAGAVFVLLGIGAIFMVTGDLDMFHARSALMMANPELVKWILISLTAGFAVKMAAVPVHMWLPDAHSEAPAPMSALLSGVIISAGAYAILRISLGTVFPAVMATDFASQFLHGLTIFGIMSAFFGSLIALVETDIKRIIAYSSIAHMGYVLFGLSLFPFQEATIGTVLHLVNHAVSKGLLFLTAGAVMKRLEIRDVREMGGLAGQMSTTAVSSTIAALSIAGVPPFACFMSEFLIFVGAFRTVKIDGFYTIPVAVMLIATVFSLAYSLRFLSHVFFGASKHDKVADVPLLMKLSMVFLAVLVVAFGVWPSLLIQFINVTFV